MKATIIGAGIGGLCTGIALKRLGYEAQVYEAVRDIRPVGAAISVWSNGIKCLNYLGLARDVAALGGQMDAMAYRDGLTGETMTDFSLLPLMERVGQRPYPVSRAELQAMLMEKFGKEDVHLGMCLTHLEETDEGVIAHFEDGSTAEGDILVGADGARSIVRDYVRGVPTERLYSGYVNWNGLVEIDETLAPADAWTTWVGEGKRVSLMPIAGNRFYFFFDVPLPPGLPNDRAAYKSDLREHFSGWASPVQDLIARLNPDTTNRVEIFDVEPFPSWVRGRVALLGDSAHNTSPDLGQGGCLAMEDAVVLGQCMAAHRDLGPQKLLQRYSDLRAPRGGELVLRARKRGAITHGLDPAAMEAWYAELRQETGE
ncbi:MAG: FAD-dependent urate hydroxylase HpxO, partial [Pseudomonadota bacterium]